jgi:hydroxymethylpyrimidine pyrophosphatase-like HAD family hydrolase
MVPQLELPVSGAYGICSNGARLVELENGQTIDEFPMSKALTITALTTLHRAIPTMHFAADCSSGFYVEENFKYSWRLRSGAIPASIMSVVTAGDQVYKLTAFCDGIPEEKLCGRIDHILHGLLRTTYGASSGIVELTAPDIDKGAGLDRIARILNLDMSNAIAFGDAPNDIPIFDRVGWAIAVANAHRDLLKRADEIVASNNADGVAAVIEELLGNSNTGRSR